MLKYIGRKLLQLLSMLFIISILIYVGLDLMGVDPAAQKLDPENFNLEDLERLHTLYGLDDPLLIRYGRWILNMLHGDLGRSIVNDWDIAEKIATRLPATFELAFCSLIISTILGVTLGILCAAHQNSVADNAGRVVAVLSNAMPSYFLALILLQVFAIRLGWFPVQGRTFEHSKSIFDRLQYLALPVLAQSIGMCSGLMRYARNNMLDISNKDFVNTARSKGLPEWKVYLKHIFRNSMRPVMISVVFRLTTLVGGSVAIETIFSWPGIGTVITDAVVSSDYNVVLVTVLMIATVLLIASFLIDVLTALLDPRVRFEE